MKRKAAPPAISPQDGTFERLREVIVEQLGVDQAEVTADAKFIDDFGIDSLDEIELVMAAEEEFGIEIPDGEFAKAETVEHAVRLLDQRIAMKKGSRG